MDKLFDVVPSGFLNCLSSGSNYVICSYCLQIIYEQYDKEIFFQRNRVAGRRK